jgi:hypothetical protein
VPDGEDHPRVVAPAGATGIEELAPEKGKQVGVELIQNALGHFNTRSIGSVELYRKVLVKLRTVLQDASS